MISSYNLNCDEKLRLIFFTEVNNMAEIVEQFSEASPKVVDCAMLNPELIMDAFQILVAANKAVIAKRNNTLVTRDLCTELLFNLSISDNITESLQKFGYGSPTETHDLLIAVFGNGNQPEHFISEVQGKLENLRVLREKCNLNTIKKTYDVMKNIDNYNELLDLIITKIACKSIF